jgi:hypothetical protein
MRSRRDRRFRALFAALPRNVQVRAGRAYQLWRADSGLPGLNFKLVDPDERIYSIRIGRDYRALGKLEGDVIVWFWIGKHDEYDRILN